jgi:hypothetical protein
MNAINTSEFNSLSINAEHNSELELINDDNELINEAKGIYLISYKQKSNRLMQLEVFEEYNIAFKVMKRLMRESDLTNLQFNDITNMNDKSEFINNIFNSN